ncbi:MAG: redoxin domain-containing protein [Saprospiraceae bacterium]|nr:redoxin domain-containing protein [Saprospiraceae bacterium]
MFILFLPFDLTAQGFDPPILDFSGFKPYLEKDNDTIYVINFWATWCRPCVEELPLLEKLESDQFEHPLEVILVSLDFRNQVETKLVPFISEHDLQSKIIVLDDPDANSWIDQVDERWSGALPATVVYRGQKRLFFPDAFADYQSLKSTLINF